jgi:prepilin peptidase CpaA
MESQLLTIAFVGLLGGAAWTDVRSRRIPNVLVVAGLFVGLVLRGLAGGGALLDAGGGAVVALGIGVAAYATGALGAGDAKLLCAAGAYLGLARLPEALVLIALAGGALALLEAVRRGRFLGLLRDGVWLGLYVATVGRHGVRRTLATPGAVAIPYGLAISVGAFGAWLI